MPEEFGHETLAEFHHLVIGFPLGIKIRSSLGPSHRKGCKAVLEYLFEGEEFQNAEINGGMKSQSSLVWADGAVHLYPVTPVYLHFTLVVQPWYPENDGTFRFRYSLKYL